MADINTYETKVQFVEILLNNTELDIDQVREEFVKVFGPDDFDQIVSELID